MAPNIETVCHRYKTAEEPQVVGLKTFMTATPVLPVDRLSTALFSHSGRSGRNTQVVFREGRVKIPQEVTSGEE